MTLIPVYCKQCGGLYATESFIRVEGSVDGLHLGENTLVGACPNCQDDLTTVPGTYNVAAGITTFISGPEASREKIASLISIIRDAREGSVSPDELAERANRELPEIAGAIIRILLDPKLLIALLPVLVMMIWNAKNYEQAERHHIEKMDHATKHHAELVEEAMRDASQMSLDDIEAIVQQILVDTRNDALPPDSQSTQFRPPE